MHYLTKELCRRVNSLFNFCPYLQKFSTSLFAVKSHPLSNKIDSGSTGLKYAPQDQGIGPCCQSVPGTGKPGLVYIGLFVSLRGAALSSKSNIHAFELLPSCVPLSDFRFSADP